MKTLHPEVRFMSGDRTDGYYYVAIGEFVLCEDGHPEFPLQFPENERGKREADEFVKSLKNLSLEDR